MNQHTISRGTPPGGSDDRLKVALASAVGTTVENYDFTAFGTAAALYLGAAFFPGSDPSTATLYAFATLGIGFAVRPLGGLIGGYLGDKFGRKPVLLLSLFVMGLATVGIGLLPTYAQIGFWAPVLLTTVRVLQGLAFGAEWGGAIMITFEHAPWKKRGRFTAIPQAGVPAGLFLANVVFLATAGWDNDWAWRVPFLASSILIVVGLIIRITISESPEFLEVKAAGEIKKNPIASVFRHEWKNILRVIGMRVAETGGFYIIVSYFLSYITNENFAERALGLTCIVIAAAIGIVTTIYFGGLTDRFGRKPLYLLGTAGIIVFSVPSFLLAQSGNPVLIVLLYVIGLSILHDSLAASQGGWFSELFSASTRTSGASIGYQFSAAIAGFIPFIAASAAIGAGWLGVAGVYAAIGVIGFLAALSTAETWSAERRAEVDEEIRNWNSEPAKEPVVS